MAGAGTGGPDGGPGPQPGARPADRRELDVLDRLADGHRAVAIADELVLSLTTVRSHIRSILIKLEVSSQLEAVALSRGGPPGAAR